jgi:hypothetical protein
MTTTELVAASVASSVELETRAIAWPDRARALKIVDAQSYVESAELLNEIKDLRREIHNTFDPIVGKAYDAHKEAIKQKKRHEDPLVIAEAIIKGSIVAYDYQQEQIRQAEEARLRDEARKREEERILLEAIEAEQDGDTESAAEILAEPIVTPLVHAAPNVPKVSGISMRETWTFEVTNLHQLIAHCASHPEDANLLQANSVAIGAMVRARGKAFNVPGIRAGLKKGVAAGGKR